MEDRVSSSFGAVQAPDNGMIRTKDILTKSHALISMHPDSLESSTLLHDSLHMIQETSSYYTGTDSEKIGMESDVISSSSQNISIGHEQSFEIELQDSSQFPKSAVIYTINDAIASSEGNLFSFPIEDLHQKDISTFTDGALIFIRSEGISEIQNEGEEPITNEITQECLASPQTSIVYPSACKLMVANISNVHCRRSDRVSEDQHDLAQTLEGSTKSKDNMPKEDIQTFIEALCPTKESVSINPDIHVNLGEIHSSRNILPQNNAFESSSGINKDMVNDKKDKDKTSLSAMKDGDFEQGHKSSEPLMGVGFYKDDTDIKSNLGNNNEHQRNKMLICQPVAAKTEILKVKDNIVSMDKQELSGDEQQLMTSALNSEGSQDLMNTPPVNDLARDSKTVFIPMITSQGTTSQILVARQFSPDVRRVAAEMMPSPCLSKSCALQSPKLSTNRELGKCTQGFKLPYHMAGKKLVIIQCQKPSGKAEIKLFEKVNSQKLVINKGKCSNGQVMVSSQKVLAAESQSISKMKKNTSSVISKVDAATETDESFLMQQRDNTRIGHINDQSKESTVSQSVFCQEKFSKSSEITESRKDSIEVFESVICMNKDSSPKMNEFNEGQEVDIVLEHEEDDFCFQGNILATQCSKKRKIDNKEDIKRDMGRSEDKSLSFVKPSDKEVEKSLAADTSIDGSFKGDRRNLGKVDLEMDSQVKNKNENILKESECNVSSVNNDSFQLQSYTKRDARCPRVDYKNLNCGVFSLKSMLPSTAFEKNKLSSMNASGYKTTDIKQSRKKILNSKEKDNSRLQKSVHLNCERSKKEGSRCSKQELCQSLPETIKVQKSKDRERSDDEMSSSFEVKPVNKKCKLQGKFKTYGKVLLDKQKINHPAVIEHNGFVSSGVTADKDLKDELQTLVCKWCEKPYASLKSLAAHRKCCKMSPNARPKPHICEICNKGFATSLYLKQHAAVHTGLKKYICKVCNKGFSNQGNLYTHMGIHNPNKRFLCAHCGKGFSQHVNLKYHLKTSVGKCAADRKDCPFACEKCGNRFTSNKRLKQHEQIHQKYKIESFSCEHCQRVFKSYPLLERHVRIHTGIKPFKCKVCNMAFAQQNNLDAHALTHSDVRPYHCAICQRGFIQRTNFKTHMLKKHGLAPNILPRMRNKSRKKDVTSFQFILIENETHASLSQGQWTQTVDSGTDINPKSSNENLRS